MILKSIFNTYINSNVHVAISVFSLTWITGIEFNYLYDKYLLYFVFFATIVGYNFIKYFEVAKFHKNPLTGAMFIPKLKAIPVVSFFSFILMCYFGVLLKESTLICIVFFGIITFLYAIPFLPQYLLTDKKQNLRNISGLKIYVIAFIWTGVSVFLPLINQQHNMIETDVLLAGLQRFIFVMVLMFPFEIRDLKYDNPKLATIPQIIGLRLTKVAGIALLIIFFFLEFLKNEVCFLNLSVLLIITAITGLFLIFAKVKQKKYYSMFWVEGLPTLWLILILLTD